MARHKLFLAQDSEQGEVTVGQRVSLKPGGRLNVKTLFQGGDFYEGEMIKLTRPAGGIESAADVADHHWTEMRAELEQIRDEAATYAKLKARGKNTELLTGDLMIPAIGYYSEQIETTMADRAKEMHTGFETSKFFPHTQPGEHMAWFRGAVQFSPRPQLKALKLDQVERSLSRAGKLFEQTTMMYVDFMGGGSSEESRGGLKMRDGRPKRTQNVIAGHWAQFFRATDEVLEAASTAWWAAAKKIADNEKLDPVEVQQHADLMRDKLAAAKRAFQQMESEVQDSHMAYEFRQLHELVTGHDESGHIGLLPTLDKIYGVVSREALLQTTIEAGRAPDKKK